VTTFALVHLPDEKGPSRGFKTKLRLEPEARLGRPYCVLLRVQEAVYLRLPSCQVTPPRATRTAKLPVKSPVPRLAGAVSGQSSHPTLILTQTAKPPQKHIKTAVVAPPPHPSKLRHSNKVCYPTALRLCPMLMCTLAALQCYVDL
jgi:hypothetical protein